MRQHSRLEKRCKNMTVVEIKQSVLRLALREKWSIEQIQLAEDYIDALERKRSTERVGHVNRTIGLHPKHAEKIRDRFKR